MSIDEHRNWTTFCTVAEFIAIMMFDDDQSRLIIIFLTAKKSLEKST